jgi:hypothetical protein
LARPKVEQHSIRIDPIMATFVVDSRKSRVCASLRMGRSAPLQAADHPDHDGNKQDQAKDAAKAGPAIPAVAIVAAASEQQNQQDDNQNCAQVTFSLKF